MIPSSDKHPSNAGPVSRLSPPNRLICGITVLAITLIIPVGYWYSVLAACTLTAGWILCCKVPGKSLLHVLTLATGMFAPFLVLAPLTHYKTGLSWLESFITPLRISLRGTLCMLTCTATFSTLNLSELRGALYSLPLPRIVSVLILQIVHQSTMLKKETSRMLAAYRLRGLTTAGFLMRMRCLCAFPVLWLLRLTIRAERIGNAMELRGFTESINTHTD